MTVGQLSAIAAGVLWLASACVLREVARVLGPSFHTTATVAWGWRALTNLGALIMLGCGLTFLFPGRLVEVSRVSIMAPLGAVAVLGVTSALLDWVMRDRAPPPWSVQVMRLAAVFGRRSVIEAGMAVPPAPMGASLPEGAPDPHRRSRLPILIGAAAVIVGIAVFLVLNSQVSATY